MRVALTTTITFIGVGILVGSALAAPGDPRAVRGSLEWPATLSAEPFIVVRGDDGHSYYADVSHAQRTATGSISGRISLLGLEGNQPHEIAAVIVGQDDSALAYTAPSAPTATQAAPAPSSPAPQAVPPTPPAPPQPSVTAPPSMTAAAPPAATPAAASETTTVATGTDDLWRVYGKVTAVTPREFVVETRPGETVRVDVSKLSAWTRQTVRAGDEVKLFGVPQDDRRLVANGFIQEVPAGAGSQ